MFQELPNLGVGLGYRHNLHEQIIDSKKDIEFLEVITDQFIYAPTERQDLFFDAMNSFRLVPHSVGMSVGTDTPLDDDYIRRTAEFVERAQAPWTSDHLSMTKVPEVDLGQLAPIWFTKELVKVVCRNVANIRASIGVPFLLENITYYFPIPMNQMTEAEFITEIVEKSGCGILLDLNNVYLNSMNLRYDPYRFLESIPLERVVQIHIAGYEQSGDLLVDTHGAKACESVWELLKFILNKSPINGISIEWDQHFPEFEIILDELAIARSILGRRKHAHVESRNAASIG